jgi:hypothetical protein
MGATAMFRAAIIGILLGSLLVLVQPETAQGRKEYFDGFLDQYPNLAPQANAQKCLVCNGKQKKDRSDYARELERELGARNVKNKESDPDRSAEDRDTGSPARPNVPRLV